VHREPQPVVQSRRPSILISLKSKNSVTLGEDLMIPEEEAKSVRNSPPLLDEKKMEKYTD
jgi:hypothetical protein